MTNAVIDSAILAEPTVDAKPVGVAGKPSSEEQALQACRAILARSDYRPLRRLDCDWAGGAVVLTGAVPSYYLKQLATSSVQQAVRPWHVRNEIVVRETGVA